MLFTFLQTSSEAAGVAVEGVQQELSFSLLSLAAQGGWLMIVLALLSIIAIYIFAERLFAISYAGKIDKNFTKDISII